MARIIVSKVKFRPKQIIRMRGIIQADLRLEHDTEVCQQLGVRWVMMMGNILLCSYNRFPYVLWSRLLERLPAPTFIGPPISEQLREEANFKEFMRDIEFWYGAGRITKRGAFS